MLYLIYRFNFYFFWFHYDIMIITLWYTTAIKENSTDWHLLPYDKRNSCKRSFLVMRRIQTWTHTSMGCDRLSLSSTIRIERDITLDTVILNKYCETRKT